MSFRGGGRGGGRFGGRGGGGAGGGGGGGGAPMTEEERKAVSYAFPTPTYPPIAVPLQSKPSRNERLYTAQFLTFRKQVRDGPFFMGSYTATTTKSTTTNDNNNKNGKSKSSNIIIEIDDGQKLLNDGIKRYTDRYHKKRKIGSKRAIDEHPYVIEFFPKELHEPMGVIITTNNKRKSKKLDISRFKAELLLTEEFKDIEEEDEETRERLVKAKIAELKADADGNNNTENKTTADDSEPEDPDEEELDDEFEEDDDDDYNAEKYFDDGEGMDDDDGYEEAAY